MEKWIFCSKGSNEAISTCLATTKEDAVEIFSRKKELCIDAFLEIYDVKNVTA
jgi:hypothetical protein